MKVFDNINSWNTLFSKKNIHTCVLSIGIYKFVKRKAPALDTAIDVDKYCQNIFTTVGVTKN